MTVLTPPARLDPRKFRDPERTLDGSARARVSLERLETLWINTGTLCNVTCRGCYIESSPRNDRLTYIAAEEVGRYLDEIETSRTGTVEIGFTGGEPFMNPDFMDMLEDALGRGLRALVLTNAMRPMRRAEARLAALPEAAKRRLVMRVSLDHHTRERHEAVRGPSSWAPAVDGLGWLARAGFTVHVASRTKWSEGETARRRGFARLFAALGVAIDAADPTALVLFPEIDGESDVPEISERCWDVLGVAPNSVMCARSRMVVKRKGEAAPSVVACTLLPYDEAFELGRTLAEAARPVALNHPRCARFCVLGGASCSRTAA